MQSHLPAIHHADTTKMKENPSWFQAIPQTLPTPTHISDENASEARGGGVVDKGGFWYSPTHPDEISLHSGIQSSQLASQLCEERALWDT